jgi:hypothetical protein
LRFDTSDVTNDCRTGTVTSPQTARRWKATGDNNVDMTTHALVRVEEYAKIARRRSWRDVMATSDNSFRLEL